MVPFSACASGRARWLLTAITFVGAIALYYIFPESFMGPLMSVLCCILVPFLSFMTMSCEKDTEKK